MQTQSVPTGAANPAHPSFPSPAAQPAPTHAPEAPATAPQDSRTAKARLMRLKHGLNSKYAVIPGEDIDAFKQYRADLVEHLRPLGALECGAAEQLIMAQ